MNSYITATRRHGRILSILLLSFFGLTLLGANPAPAYATGIANGEIVSGSVTGTGTQSWSFSAPTVNFSAYIVGSINVASPDARFKPGIKVFFPDTTLA